MKNDTSLIVNEIFSSIQGESSFAGEPFVFIRLTGCNLRCRYCDTAYAWSEGKKTSIHNIMRKVHSFKGIRKALITGGEPLFQEGTSSLAKLLVMAGYTVLVETNGSLPLGGFPTQVIFIMDIKTPSSGVHTHNRISNLAKLRKSDELKFVISGKKDYLWVRTFLKRYRPNARILLSAMEGKLSLASLAKWMMRDCLEAKLQPRLHKLIQMR